MNLITESFITSRIRDYMEKLQNGEKWHPEKTVETGLHEHGPDLVLRGGKTNGEYFFIECKGKSYAPSSRSINKEGWIVALGQLITRIDTKRYTKSKETNTITSINRAYKYGLGLYWESAQVALRRIHVEAAEVLNLHVFAVNDDGDVKVFTPSQFGKDYPDGYFK